MGDTNNVQQSTVNNGVILTDIKKLLGVMQEDDSFDDELVLYINSVAGNLIQMGIGPEEGIDITKESKWSDIIGQDKRFASIKNYIHLKVKLLFDPPTNSTVKQSLDDQVKEFETRNFWTAELDAYKNNKS